MKISYDKKADAVNIVFREGRVKKTLELAPEVLLDVDRKGRPLYLEVIGASEKLGKKNAQEVTLNPELQAHLRVSHAVSQGVRIMKLDPGDKVASVVVV